MTFSWNITLSSGSSVIFGISKAFVLMSTDTVFAVFLQPLASIAIVNTLGWVELFFTSNKNSIVLFQVLPSGSTGTRTLVFTVSKMVRLDSPLNIAGGSLILQFYQIYLCY